MPQKCYKATVGTRQTGMTRGMLILAATTSMHKPFAFLNCHLHLTPTLDTVEEVKEVDIAIGCGCI